MEETIVLGNCTVCGEPCVASEHGRLYVVRQVFEGPNGRERLSWYRHWKCKGGQATQTPETAVREPIHD